MEKTTQKPVISLWNCYQKLNIWCVSSALFLSLKQNLTVMHFSTKSAIIKSYLTYVTYVAVNMHWEATQRIMIAQLIRLTRTVVSIATCYRLDSKGIDSGWGARFSAPIQTGPGAHLVSCTMGTRFLSQE